MAERRRGAVVGEVGGRAVGGDREALDAVGAREAERRGPGGGGRGGAELVGEDGGGDVGLLLQKRRAVASGGERKREPRAFDRGARRVRPGREGEIVRGGDEAAGLFVGDARERRRAELVAEIDGGEAERAVGVRRGESAERGVARVGDVGDARVARGGEVRPEVGGGVEGGEEGEAPGIRDRAFDRREAIGDGVDRAVGVLEG